MKYSFLILLALTATMAACTGSNSPTATVATPTAPTSTETFPGTVQVGGVSFSPFNVSQAGTVTVTLTAAGPPSTIWMGLGIGTPSATTCAVIQADSTITQAGATAQLSGTLTAGSYCVQVYDIGNQVAPVTYSVTVAHT
jgi:hypothetical protein